MKYLGSPDAALVTMWVAARHLAVHGPMAEDQLASALRPREWTTGEGIALGNSIRVGIDLGLLEQTEAATPEICVGRALADHKSWIHEFDGLAAKTRFLLINQANRRADDRSDVADGIAWLLRRDWRRPQDLIKDDRPPGTIIVNPTQFTAFARWSRDLGVAVEVSRKGLSPDPTGAIRRDVQPLRGRRLSARSFADHLAMTLPIGPTHELVDPGGAHEDKPNELEVFSSVGYALKRLEAEDLLRLEIADDAPERIIFRFPGPTDPFESVTHVEVHE